jgi:hypothetical protein
MSSGDLPGVELVRPTGLFCSIKDDACALERDGEFLWMDDSHLKPAGIDLFFPEILQRLRTATLPAG